MRYCDKFLKELEEFVDISGKTVVDLGAWIGQFTKYFQDRAGLVISVEPDIRNFKEVIKGIGDNVIPVFVAIGKKTEMRKFRFYRCSWKNTLFHKSGAKDREVLIRNILTISWDDLMEHLGIEHVDFVKVNIEGAEEELFEGMTKVFPDKMIIEHHLKNKITDVQNLRNLLELKGYKIIKEEDYNIYAIKYSV